MPRLFWKTFLYYTEWKLPIKTVVTIDSIEVFFNDKLVHSEWVPVEDYHRIYEIADKYVRQNFYIWYDDCKDLTLPKTINRTGKYKKVLPTIDDMYKELREKDKEDYEENDDET